MEVVHPRLGREAVVATHATPFPEPRMDSMRMARTIRHSRMLIVQRLASGRSVAGVAAAHGVSVKTVRKWRARFVAGGEAGPMDRSSRPRHSPTSRPTRPALISARRSPSRYHGKRSPLSGSRQFTMRDIGHRLAAPDP
jgi:hypothetical protein